MAKSDLRIDILGTSVTISTDEDPEYLQNLLDKYRRTIESVQRISGLKDPLKTAVLTGFLLSDDLEKAGKTAADAFSAPGEKPRQVSGDESGEAEQLTLGMISRLEEALNAPRAAPFTGDDVQAAETGAPPASAPIAVFKLQNTVKNYAWGSPEWIPALLGAKNPARIPWAELWMGVSPAGPSRVILPGKAGTSSLLSELIKTDPESFLGKETARNFGTLPFLFKVEAAAKPLSVQTHPSREQAREGFERENREGIPLDAPNRSYRDANHKPEIICALTTFAALCGFKEKKRIGALLDILSKNSEGALKAGLENLVPALTGDEPFEAFLTALFNMDDEVREALGPFIRTRQARLERDYPEYRDEWGLCSYLAALYPGDSGILTPLYLNIIELAPGEAMYLPAGVLHAYIHGMGMELMADSDNVLRGGLTSKHVDRRELLKVLSFSEYEPKIFKVPESAPAWYTYPAPTEDFFLSVMRSTSENAVAYPETGPAIVFLVEGDAVVSEAGKAEQVVLSKGESVFIPARCSRGKLVFSGTFTAYAASAGRGGPVQEEKIPDGQIPQA